MITCSGVGFDGSLRIIRSGIGFSEQASIELPGVKGMWSMKRSLNDFDTYLVLTFIGETRVLGLNDEDELDEVALEGFDADSATLWCGEGIDGQYIQVTDREIRVVNSQGIACSWRHQDGRAIVAAAGNPSQIAAATDDGFIYVLGLENGQLTQLGQIKVGSDISCLDVSILPGQLKSEILVVGTWSLKLILFSLKDFSEIDEYRVGGEVMPRSVLMATFDDVPYILCGLGDGMLLTYRLDGQKLVDRKRLAIGTKPINLRSFKMHGSKHVFAACDRPTVIYMSNGKMMFSNLNEDEVHFIAGFSTSNFPDSLAIVKAGSMVIGTMENIQRLHVRTVPLNEQPRRIAHQASTKTLMVAITSALANLPNQVDSARLIDDQTFETLDVFKLAANEMVCSAHSGKLVDEIGEFYILGTAFTPPAEPEPSEVRYFTQETNFYCFKTVLRRTKLITPTSLIAGTYLSFRGE